MNKYNLKNFIGNEVSVYVRYGFKKQTGETQNYKGILKNVDEYGVSLDRKIGENFDINTIDFFPWHNIDAIRYEYEADPLFYNGDTFD